VMLAVALALAWERPELIWVGVAAAKAPTPGHSEW
jgi:hypothetical protein